MKHIKQLVLSNDFEIEEDVIEQDSNGLNIKRKGDFAEYYAVTWLWDQGYEVFQNSGCTGPVDMIALKGDKVTLIDVKTFRKRGRASERKNDGNFINGTNLEPSHQKDTIE